MKSTKCPNCSREVYGKGIMALCRCGEMVEFNTEIPEIQEISDSDARKREISNNTTQDDQVILKTVFERGVRSGKEPDAQQILDEVLNERIKVNLE
jgi:threonine synthase